MVLLVSVKTHHFSSCMLIFFFSRYQMGFKQKLPICWSSWEKNWQQQKKIHEKSKIEQNAFISKGPLILCLCALVCNLIFLPNFLLFRWCSHFVACISMVNSSSESNKVGEKPTEATSSWVLCQGPLWFQNDQRWVQVKNKSLKWSTMTERASPEILFSQHDVPQGRGQILLP